MDRDLEDRIRLLCIARTLKDNPDAETEAKKNRISTIIDIALHELSEEKRSLYMWAVKHRNSTPPLLTKLYRKFPSQEKKLMKDIVKATDAVKTRIVHAHDDVNPKLLKTKLVSFMHFNAMREEAKIMGLKFKSEHPWANFVFFADKPFHNYLAENQAVNERFWGEQSTLDLPDGSSITLKPSSFKISSPYVILSLPPHQSQRKEFFFIYGRELITLIKGSNISERWGWNNEEELERLKGVLMNYVQTKTWKVPAANIIKTVYRVNVLSQYSLPSTPFNVQFVAANNRGKLVHYNIIQHSRGSKEFFYIEGFQQVNYDPHTGKQVSYMVSSNHEMKRFCRAIFYLQSNAASRTHLGGWPSCEWIDAWTRAPMPRRFDIEKHLGDAVINLQEEPDEAVYQVGSSEGRAHQPGSSAGRAHQQTMSQPSSARGRADQPSSAGGRAHQPGSSAGRAHQQTMSQPSSAGGRAHQFQSSEGRAHQPGSSAGRAHQQTRSLPSSAGGRAHQPGSSEGRAHQPGSSGGSRLLQHKGDLSQQRGSGYSSSLHDKGDQTHKRVSGQTTALHDQRDPSHKRQVEQLHTSEQQRSVQAPNDSAKRLRSTTDRDAGFFIQNSSVQRGNSIAPASQQSQPALAREGLRALHVQDAPSFSHQPRGRTEFYGNSMESEEDKSDNNSSNDGDEDMHDRHNYGIDEDNPEKNSSADSDEDKSDKNSSYDSDEDKPEKNSSYDSDEDKSDKNSGDDRDGNKSDQSSSDSEENKPEENSSDSDEDIVSSSFARSEANRRDQAQHSDGSDSDVQITKVTHVDDPVASMTLNSDSDSDPLPK
jgi:hypothetical protein